MTNLPEYLKQGEHARLFPILADTNRERRITSLFLALLPHIPALAADVLGAVGVRVGKRTKIESFTEVVFKEGKDINVRPDGLIIVSNSTSRWSALVEAKIGKAKLNPEQIEKYLELAKLNGIDAIITISNEFVDRADHSPVSVPKTLLHKVDLFHWSWTGISTKCDILAYQKLWRIMNRPSFLPNGYAFLLIPALVSNDSTRWARIGKF